MEHLKKTKGLEEHVAEERKNLMDALDQGLAQAAAELQSDLDAEK